MLFSFIISASGAKRKHVYCLTACSGRFFLVFLFVFLAIGRARRRSTWLRGRRCRFCVCFSCTFRPFSTCFLFVFQHFFLIIQASIPVIRKQSIMSSEQYFPLSISTWLISLFCENITNFVIVSANAIPTVFIFFSKPDEFHKIPIQYIEFTYFILLLFGANNNIP